jgi:hypothetical protein
VTKKPENSEVRILNAERRSFRNVLSSLICVMRSELLGLNWLLVSCLVFSSGFAADTTAAPVRSYPGKYVLASLALPGAGEMLRNSRTKGEVFLWTDAAIWVTYGGLEIVGGARNQGARLFARRYSGASATVGNDDYYVNLERYPNSDQYNEDVRRDARELYPDDPEKQKAYAATHYYTGNQAWNWGSDSLRYTYWYQRRGARSALHTAAFLLGAALLNRLVSGVDVAFFTPEREPDQSNSGLRSVQDPRSKIQNPVFGRLGVAPTLDQPDRPGLALFYRF